MIPLLHQPARRAIVIAAIAAAIVGTSALAASEGSESELAEAPQAANSYRVDTVDLPAGIDSEIGALTFNDAGELIVVTRHSGIVIGTPTDGGLFLWKTFCDQILDNPTGVLAEPGGTLLVAQRHELTRLHDTDDDGVADYFEAVVATEAPITAGTQPDGEGNWLLALATGQGRARWQGWTMKVDPDGNLTPLCSGIHRSGGIATDRSGNFFATDIAGEWTSEHAFRILEKDLFHGDPAALLWDSDFASKHTDPLAWAKNNPNDLATKTIPPVVRIPAGDFCGAPGELAFHLGDDDSFGPFTGQCFIADSGSTGGRLLRVMPELVDDKWQGSIARFDVKGLSGANAHRLCFNAAGTQLYVGQTRANNNALPKLQRITAVRGNRPFALLNVRTLPSGLQLNFTDEVNRSLAIDTKNYAIQRHSAADSKPGSAVPQRAVITPDGRTVSLFFETDSLLPGFRYTVDLKKLKSQSDNKIDVGEVHHTIHQIPGDLPVTIPHPKPRPEEDKAEQKEKAEDETVKTGGAPESDAPAPESEKKG